MLNKKILEEAAVNHKTFREKTSDRVELYIQRWDPVTSVKAVVFLIHGFGEHSSRYDFWTEKFVASGYSFFSYDLRGHGNSSGKRGYAPSFEAYLKDIDFILEKVFSLYPNTPVFLYGHSFGGNLAANYLIRNIKPLKGLILTSPWFKLTEPQPVIKMAFAKLLKRILPGLVIKSGLKPEYISRDLRVVHNYKSDPLIHDKIGVRLGLEIMQYGMIASRSVYKINLPVLIMHGSDDRITDCKASAEFVQNASKRVTHVEWEGCYHELHNDLDQEKVFDTIIAWLNKHI